MGALLYSVQYLHTQVALCEGKALTFVLIKSCFPELKKQNSFLIPIVAPSLLHLPHDPS